MGMTDEARQRAAQLADQLFEHPVTPQTVQLIEQFDAEAYRRGLEEAAKQVCMYCSGHAKGYQLGVAGPNSAGNYTHNPPEDSWAKDSVLCKATSIWSLIRYNDRLAQEARR